MRLLLLLLMNLGLAVPALGAEVLRVAVAANFRATLEQVNTVFEQQTGQVITLSSASTGVLATQILHGAPFDLFFAADDQAPATLLDRGVGQRSDCYAVGKLALVGSDKGLKPLADPALSLAIANPETAPYGRAAAEILAREEFAPAQGRKLVRGNNVLQAFQFWRSGAVDLALVAQSLAPDSATPIPVTWHQPLEQHVLLLNDSPAAAAYLNWIRSDTVRTQILDAGYEPCP